MRSSDVKRRRDTLLQFLHEQTCDGLGFPVHLENGMSIDCVELFLAGNEETFQTQRARKLCKTLKRHYGVTPIPLEEEIVEKHRSGPKGETQGREVRRVTVVDSPPWVGDLHRDLQWLKYHELIEYMAFGLSISDGCEFSPGSMSQYVSQIVITKAGAARLAVRPWLFRIFEQHPGTVLAISWAILQAFWRGLWWFWTVVQSILSSGSR